MRFYGIDEVDYEEAIAALRKQRDDNLILIETEHQMRIDSANKLAKFEEERLQQFFEVRLWGRLVIRMKSRKSNAKSPRKRPRR